MPVAPHRNLEEARRLDKAGKRQEALATYQAFLDEHPGALDGWVELGGLLMILGRLPEAWEACQRALSLEPGHYGALVHAASVLMRQGDLPGSARLFRTALAQDPSRLAGRLMFSDCLAEQGDLDQARRLLEGILEQVPDHAIALDRLNTLMARQGDWTGLRKDMERQLARYSGAEAEYVASHLDLMFGDMPRGWLRFESRLDIPGRASAQRSFPQPQWQGEPFPGRTLLLTWEQGFGDTLMFLRFATEAKQLGGRVLVEVQTPLVDIAATCPGIDEVVPEGQSLPPFDLHAPLLSLPALFRTDLESIPAAIPYLDVPTAVPDREAIADALGAGSDRVRIGICWAGNSKHAMDDKRSLAPAALAPLKALPDVAWYSFQFEAQEEPPLPGLVTLGPLLKGFPNTACALSGMDLVITVDTVLAHLAGALGIPTFLLLSFIPDWRWMMGRDTSPWYPTLRLYRQPAPGDWNSVLRQITQDLAGEA
ncbi:MAG TPA: tetratricopeptide repeat-containing glycosyltransferase family protein [Geothrix sp.]|nr:tetratricopeptide repeat-containing glycosyltransferase family protein [Geothrix sp.]